MEDYAAKSSDDMKQEDDLQTIINNARKCGMSAYQALLEKGIIRKPTDNFIKDIYGD